MPTVKGLERIRPPEKIQSDGRVTQAGMPRLTAEHFDADLARGLGHLGHVSGQIADEMAYLKAKAEAAVQEADSEAKSSELVSSAGVMLKEADIRVRETADHTNYRRSIRQGSREHSKNPFQAGH